MEPNGKCPFNRSTDRINGIQLSPELDLVNPSLDKIYWIPPNQTAVTSLNILSNQVYTSMVVLEQ